MGRTDISIVSKEQSGKVFVHAHAYRLRFVGIGFSFTDKLKNYLHSKLYDNEEIL